MIIWKITFLFCVFPDEQTYQNHRKFYFLPVFGDKIYQNVCYFGGYLSNVYL